jgi:cellulose synthase (UDP-forming)
VVALLALGWGTVYLTWRLLETGRAINPEAFYVLWLVELYNFVSLAFLAFFGWRWSEPVRPPATPGYKVDVFVATYNEPREVVEATLAGCAALRYPHETYLLDDGRRWEMAALAAQWGAHWITRPENSHAKAGNVNHALGCTSGDLIFCLDADHVCYRRDYLRTTVGMPARIFGDDFSLGE